MPAFCESHDIDFYNLREGFQSALNDGAHLEHDGHLSDQGARLTAELLAKHLEESTP